MKRILLFLLCSFLFLQQGFSQVNDTTWYENFDNAGANGFVATPANSWRTNTDFYVSPSNSYLGLVPNRIGDTTFLTTGSYDLSEHAFIKLSFSHICKISPSDKVFIQFKRGGETVWNTIEDVCYTGGAADYAFTGFNAASYPQWEAGNIAVLPEQSWWKEESFDISTDVSFANGVQFRFVMVHGSVAGTQASFGWLLDDVRVIATSHLLINPVMEFVEPLIQDTVYSTGPWEINAKVKTATFARIEQPWLKYIAMYNGIPVEQDSVLMTNVAGDSLWKATIPQFIAGINVIYSITGKDTTGNEATITSEYTIARGSGYNVVLQEGGTEVEQSYPFGLAFSYYRSMVLYTLDEIEDKAIGAIDNVGLQIADAANGTLPIKIWMKTFPSTKTSWGYYDSWDDMTQNATLVYDGEFEFSTTGWVDIPLDNLYFYDHTGSLAIFFEQDCPGYPCLPGGNFTCNNAPQTEDKMVISFSDGYWDPRFPGLRPDMRIGIMGRIDSNAAALTSMNLTDTIATRTGIPTSLSVTVLNKGIDTLRNATIYYKINDASTVQYNWTSASGLPWDFTTEVFLTDYMAKVNGADTIAIWIDYPNGKYDSVSWDDTLTKIVYGSSDFRLSFVDYFSDTVKTTGAFTISAHVSTHSSRPVSDVLLDVKLTREGITTPTSIPMQYDTRKGLWVTEIPQSQFGSHIVYSITLTDYLGNIVSIVDSFYIKREVSSGGNYIYVGDSLSWDVGGLVPYNPNYEYGSSKTLVLASELNNNMGGSINSIGYKPDYYSRGSDMENMSVYLKVVSDMSISSALWVDPVADGATLVWQGSIAMPEYNTWVEIPMNTPFILPPNSNLLIYWINSDGRWEGVANWISSPTAVPMSSYWYGFNLPHGAADGYADVLYSRPVMRFDMPGKIILDEDNSVALESIDYPLSGSVTAGQQVPIKVSIRNAGRLDLTSCRIDWALNNQPQSPAYYYTGNIWDDFVDTATIGYYTPVAGQVDEIKVWVSLPNNVADNVTSDDTLSVNTIVCDGALTGTYRIGSSADADFNSISSMLFMMKECGIAGKLTLELEDGIYAENFDLTAFSSMTTSVDTLEIVSLLGDASNVTLETRDVGVKLRDMDNVLIKNISIQVTGVGHGVLLEGNCTNVEINGCNIFMDTTTSVAMTVHTGIYKGVSGTMDNIRILNNQIKGGSVGIYFSATDSTKNRNFICNGNVLESGYRGGIVFGYSELQSVSNNTVLAPWSYNMNFDWQGLRLDHTLVDIVANNRINSLHAVSASQNKGITISETNQSVSDNAVRLFNNEIMVQSNDYYDPSSGVEIISSKVDMYHNSIYLTATTQGRALYNVSTYPVNIKNNMFVADGNFAQAIHSNASTVSMDYNNYCYGNVLGMYNANLINNFSSWQNATGQDKNSVSILPLFVDIYNSMELSSDFESYLSPMLATVQRDINNQARQTITNMGAYTLPLLTAGAVNLEFDGWDEEVIDNQMITAAVKVTNISVTPIDSIHLEWSLNKATPTPFTYIFSSPLASFASEVIVLDLFSAETVNEVDVWLKSVNEVTSLNDSIAARSEVKPLAEFVAPFMKDTIYSLTFDISALIRTQSGAPVIAPELVLTSFLNGRYISAFSLPMILTDGIWRAAVPQQYYGSTITYSLTVSDTIGNTFTIIDSVYIKLLGFSQEGQVVIGAGTTDANPYNPYHYNFSYSFTKNYYMDYEIEPNRKGGFINSIAFYNTSTYPSTIDNITFYFKAVTDSIVTSADYSDPLLEGATMVWGTTSVTATGQSWINFSLNTPFFLPPNMNLLVYCYNQNGYWNNPEIYWQSTLQSIRTSSFAYGDQDPPEYTTIISDNRPNMQINLSAAAKPYLGCNLAIVSLPEPVNTLEEICTPDYSSVKMMISNLGEDDYSFAKEPVRIGVEIIDPVGNVYFENRLVFSGGLNLGESVTVEVLSALPIIYAGAYKIKAWINSPIDNMAYDDTLYTVFISGRLGLPIEEEFANGFPIHQFESYSTLGSTEWTVTNSGIPTPNTGGSMIQFDGAAVSSAVLTTRQLDLYQASNPYLEFWYYHDPTASGSDYSYMDVSIVVAGEPTHLKTVMRKDPDGASGWTSYVIPLNQFTSVRGCVLIQFEAMNKYSGAVQYLDKIFITSDLDVAISEIFISPTPNLCDENNRNIDVVIQTMTSQSFDFSTTPVEIELDVHGTKSRIQIPGKLLEGYTSDTLRIATDITIPAGTYPIKAYFVQVIDSIPANDTAIYNLNINPQFRIELQKMTNVVNFSGCIYPGTAVSQNIKIENTGTVELSNIVMILDIEDVSVTPSSHFIVRDTLNISIPVGYTEIYSFRKPYIVPFGNIYNVGLTAYLECDSVLLHGTHAISECIDVDDIAIVTLVNPQKGVKDVQGQSVNIEVSLKNFEIAKDWEEVDITAVISSGTQGILYTLYGNLAIEGIEDTIYRFNDTYIVPDEEQYSIMVFIGKQDEYQHNDTLMERRETIKSPSMKGVNGSSILLEQNIPNPANNSTVIQYSVPAEGEVSFKIYSVNGQMLYTKSENVQSGDHQIEINTSTFAAGIYFYTMEFEGQRLTKRMSKQ